MRAFIALIALILASCSSDEPSPDAKVEELPPWLQPGPYAKGVLCDPVDVDAGPAESCKPAGAECCCGNECCSGICDYGRCRESCGAMGSACTWSEGYVEECCSQACGAHGCICAGTGEPCIQNADCCSGLCNPDSSACDNAFTYLPAGGIPERCLPDSGVMP